MHLSRIRHALAATLLPALLPAIAGAQGRLIAPLCGRPCPPNASCVSMRPEDVRLEQTLPARERVLPCGARIEKRSSVTRVQLADRVLRYEVTEVFRNEGSAVGEADYMFPLPAGAAFEDLKLSINGELVSGETLSADRARGIYEEIVRRQRDPALVEWMGSGMLRARIFPIQPGEDKKVVVRFQSVAAREGDALRVDYRRSGDFSLSYLLNDQFGEAYSPTHLLRTRDDGRTRVVSAEGSAAELTILLPLRRADAAGMSVLTHGGNAGGRGNDGAGFAMLTITPPSAPARATPRDLAFVLDVSGSMSGRKLEQAKAAGHALLNSLRPADRFRLIDFSTDVRAFRDRWVNATPAQVNEAHRYLDGLHAEGSTNISEALRTALECLRSTGAERLPLVVFVTDGEPTVGERNPDAIAASAARLRGDARVFTVGVGTGVNATLVEQLALQGRGTAHFVRDEESVEAPVSLLARRLAEPLLTDVKLSATGVRLSHVMPNGPIDVFAGQDLVVLARYDGSGEAVIRLDGRSANGPVTWSTRARFDARSTANPFVARLWAAQRIGWLAAEKHRSGGTSEMDAEIRTLGERYGIPTEFSSYLVLEPGMAVGNVAPQQSIDRSMMRGVLGAVTRDAKTASAPMPSTIAASAPPAPPTNTRFEAARGAAMQRDAKSVAMLDNLAESDAKDGAPTTRVAGNRRLSLASGVWTDARFTTAMRVVRVRPFSALYFELLRRMPDLQEVFALGDRVIVAGRTVAIELAADGAERVDAAQLAALQRDW
jgi:Ca-activated chloride channel family protein